MDMLLLIGLLIQTTWVYSAPLIYTSMAALMSEKSGIISLWIEGALSIGAICGVVYGFNVPDPFLALLLSAITTAIFTMFLAVIVIEFKADQTIAGISMNFIAPGVAMMTARAFFDGSVSTPGLSLDRKVPRWLNGVFTQNSFMDVVFNRYATEFFCFFLVALIWFVFYKTTFGLRLLSLGENPTAAQTLGINVKKMRYISLFLAGFIAGIGGASYSMVISGSYRPTLISGQGYISIAAMIFGRWTPHGAMFGALLFGLTTGLGVLMGLPELHLNIPSTLLSMLPYIITIIVLVIFVKKPYSPKALGEPF